MYPFIASLWRLASIGIRERIVKTSRSMVLHSSLRSWLLRTRSRVIAEDLQHSESEKRYYCFGKAGGGARTVRFTYRENVIRILGAGYWRRGKAIYERENKIHK